MKLSTLSVAARLIRELAIFDMKLILTLLGKFGSFSDQAATGKEAIEKIKSNTYQLVLMDINLPEMNWLEATKMIRDKISESMPIVALSASAMKEEQERAIAAGMNDFLVKPVDVEKLKGVLRRYYTP